MTEQKDPEISITERFGVSGETVDRASEVYEQTRGITGEGTSLEREVQEAIATKDKAKIEDLERFFRMADLKDKDSEPDYDDSARTVYKWKTGGRQPVAGERDIVLERAKAVGDYVTELGYETKDPKESLESTLVVKRAGDVGGEGKRFGGKMLVAVSEKSLKERGLIGVLDHEFLHTYQHGFCPKGLEEGLTCYFEKQIATKRGAKPVLGGMIGYRFDVAFAEAIKDASGEEALAKAYFRGDREDILEKLSKEDRAELESIISDFETAQRLLKYSRKKGTLGMVSSIAKGYATKYGGLRRARRILKKYYE